jgi:hypothetical protein
LDFLKNTFSTFVPLRFVKNQRKKTKIAKKLFLPSDLFIIGHDFLGHGLYKGPKFFFPIWTSWVSKDTEFHVDFKNINLVTKCT